MKDKTMNKTKKPPRVIRINPANGARKLYQNTATAARELGLDPVTLANACARRCNMRFYGGYEWAYTANGQPKTPGPFAGHSHSLETRERMSRAKDAKKKAVTVYNEDGSFRAVYESVCLAARALGFKRSSVGTAIRVGNRLHGMSFYLT